MIDKKFMQKALNLAEKAWGMTSPNPLVGCVIVRDKQIVGQGFHLKAGENHAEINALENAEDSAKSADLYVTLEPCSTHGKTPPCTEAIVKAGIKRVFIGCLDPNPAHAGKAVEILENAGIEVQTGILKKKCCKLNEAFFNWIQTGKPFVLLKMAMTLDGKIATYEGSSKWITSQASRKRVQKLRQWCDAIMVGGETFRKDNPSLTVRELSDWKQPQKILVSSQIQQKEASEKDFRVFNPKKYKWQNFLEELGEKNITALLIEGGGELAGEVLSNKIVNKIEFHIAPKILGGRNSRPVVGGDNPKSLAEALKLADFEYEKSGNDLIITAYPK